MVTSLSGLQLVGFIWFCFASPLSSEAASDLIPAPANNYGMSETFENPSSGHEDLTEVGEDSSRKSPLLAMRRPRGIFQDDYPLSKTLQDEYKIDVQDLLKEEEPRLVNSNHFGDSGLKSIRLRAFGNHILPPLSSPQLSEESHRDEANQISTKNNLMTSNIFPHPRTNSDLQWNRIYDGQSLSKRWWIAPFKTRPKMDRRAAQSKHYGCLKRCITTGKLHPIQCHTLC